MVPQALEKYLASKEDEANLISMASQKPVILTCVQPTGKLHLGNYLGAIQRWATYLETYQCYFGIVDLHALTLPYDPSELRKSTLGCIAQYIACGLDPEKCHLFRQSQVIGHTELAWILGCLTPVGRLERMTQFKDKAQKQTGQESSGFIGSGLLTYPVLMAADILLYNADRVPVGGDQKQHLELTRDLATKFNETYTPTFQVPEVDIPQQNARVMSLQTPRVKMSKSDPNPNSVLYLLDPPSVIRKKIRSAVTDSDPERRIIAQKVDSGIPNLLHILASTTDKSIEALESDFKTASYTDFKTEVAEAVIQQLNPIQGKYNELIQNTTQLNQILKSGASAAQERANRTLSKVYRKVGLT